MELQQKIDYVDENSLFLTAFLHAPIGKMIISSTGAFLKVNPSFCKFIGYSMEELLKLDFQSITYPEDIEADVVNTKRMFNGDFSSFEMEKRFIHKDGSALWGLLSCSLVRDEEGNPSFAISQVVDIHQRKMLELKLEENEKMFRSITENALDMITIHDRNGAYLYVSPSCTEVTGYEETELIGNVGGYSFVHPDDRHLLAENYLKVLRFEGKDPISFRLRKKDGIYIWLEAKCKAIPRTDTDEIQQIVVVSRDVTAHMKLLDDLEKSHRLAEMISNHSQDIITITDSSGLVRYISPAVTHILGLEPEEVVDQPNTQYWHPEDVEKLEKAAVLQNTDDGTFECRVRDKNGQYRSFETTVKAVRNSEGAIEQIVGIGRDLTERNETMHYMILSEKLSVVSQLAAGIAHEIRNPLTAIKGFTNLIKEKLDAESFYADIIVDEIARVEQIVNELLFLAKPKSLDWEKKNIHIILHQVAALLRSQANLHNINLLELFEEMEVSVWCDEKSLKQVFINIIKNAIEAMSNGGEIKIVTELKDRAIVIRFIDQGCGIPQETLNNIGSPFYTTKENGTGLGLMVSHSIIESHKGCIKIESEVNVGTVFTITLPII